MVSKTDFETLSRQVADQISGVGNQIKDVKGAIVEEVKELLADQSEEFKGLFGDLRKRLEDLESSNEQLNSSVAVLSSRLLSLEKASRTRNLILYGLEEKKGEDLSAQLVEFLHEALLIPEEDIPPIPFEAVFRIGKPPTSKKKLPRPILMKFDSILLRNLVMSNAKNLATPNEKRKSIKLGISPDLPAEMREVRARFVDEIKQAQSQKKKVRWSGSKLLIDGTVVCDSAVEISNDSSTDKTATASGKEAFTTAVGGSRRSGRTASASSKSGN